MPTGRAAAVVRGQAVVVVAAAVPVRMFGGGPQGGRWSVSLYHTYKLTDTILIRPGVPELDLLDGSATGSGGGSNRHLLELDGGVFYKGMGVAAQRQI